MKQDFEVPKNREDITDVVIKDGRIIIYTDCPSLGDFLMMSNLPELWFIKYNVYTYVSDQILFHSDETYDLIFGTNPYVKGKTSDPYNVHVNCRYPPQNVPMTKVYQDRYGLDGEVIGKLYYEPKKVVLGDVILYDVSSRNYSSTLHKLESVANNILNETIKQNPNSKVYCIRYKNPHSDIVRLTPKDIPFETLDIEDVFGYCDVLNSVNIYIGINSGAALLASSVKELYNKDLQINLFTPKNAMVWVMDNVDNKIINNM